MIESQRTSNSLDIEGVAQCIGCGCDDLHACPGGCSWFRVDYGARRGVCSCCPDHVDRWDAGDMGFQGQLEEPVVSAVVDQEYRQAVLKLLPLAQDCTGGSKPAAMVLLSAYNGDSFTVSVQDLCNLDESNFAAAMEVIFRRCRTYRSPQDVIENGPAIFEELAEQWAHMNQNRQL